MQNYYIRIEDMLSHISHKLSIIKYVVLKKIIFFFLCFLQGLTIPGGLADEEVVVVTEVVAVAVFMMVKVRFS